MDKKKTNYFKITLYALIILFIFVYISGTSGYYENQIAEDTLITSEAIKVFEEDVLNGEVLDVNNYIEIKNNDYSNVFTDVGENLNDALLIILNDGFSSLANVLSKIF